MISYCKLLRLPEFQALKFTFPTLLTAITDLLQKIIYIWRITGELCENSSKLLKLSWCSSFTYCTNILLKTVTIYYYCRKNMIWFNLISDIPRRIFLLQISIIRLYPVIQTPQFLFLLEMCSILSPGGHEGYLKILGCAAKSTHITAENISFWCFIFYFFKILIIRIWY